jgi:hypothetical protein
MDEGNRAKHNMQFSTAVMQGKYSKYNPQFHIILLVELASNVGLFAVDVWL